jgi:hypothetical protein
MTHADLLIASTLPRPVGRKLAGLAAFRGGFGKTERCLRIGEILEWPLIYA